MQSICMEQTLDTYVVIVSNATDRDHTDGTRGTTVYTDRYLRIIERFSTIII